MKLGPIISDVDRVAGAQVARSRSNPQLAQRLAGTAPLGSAVWILLVGWAVSACGYRPAYSGPPPSTRLSIAAAPSRSPESGALASVIAGLRSELSRAGALTSSGYPRVVVELVRISERGTAQTLAAPEEGGAPIPLASGALIGVTARAWVEIAPGQVERDTGDVRRTSAFGSQANASFDAAQREAALVSAGRAVGEALGRRILGEIEVTQEPM